MNIGFYIPIESGSGGGSPKFWTWFFIIAFVIIMGTLVWVFCEIYIPKCYHCGSTNITKSDPYYKPWPHDDYYIDYHCEDCGRTWDELAK